jgi:hypothetical protein
MKKLNYYLTEYLEKKYYTHPNLDRLVKFSLAMLPKYIKKIYMIVNGTSLSALREGWKRNPLFFNLNLFQVLKNTKIAANSPTQSGEEERRSQLQGHAQMPIRTR